MLNVFLNTPLPEHEPELNALTRILRANSTGFKLILLECNQLQYQTMLANDLHQQGLCQPPATFEQPIGELCHYLQKQKQQGKVNALGLQLFQLMGHYHQFERSATTLNYLREQLAACWPHPLLLWLSPEAINAIGLHAPDLWAWRVGVFHLSVPTPPFSPPPARRPLSLLKSAGKKARPERIAALEKHLANEDFWNTANKELALELAGLHIDGKTHKRAAQILDHLMDDQPGVLKLKATLGKCQLLRSIGNLDEAIQLADNALEEFKDIADAHFTAFIYEEMASTEEIKGDFEAAIQLRRKHQLPLLQQANKTIEVAATYSRIADAYEQLGFATKAFFIREQIAIPAFQQAGDDYRAAFVICMTAGFYLNRGTPKTAISLLENQVLPLFDKQGDQTLYAGAVSSLALLYFSAGFPQKALNYAAKAIKIIAETGNIEDEIFCRDNAATILLASGHPEAAESQWAQALELAKANNLEKLAKPIVLQLGALNLD